MSAPAAKLRTNSQLATDCSARFGGAGGKSSSSSFAGSSSLAGSLSLRSDGDAGASGSTDRSWTEGLGKGFGSTLSGIGSGGWTEGVCRIASVVTGGSFSPGGSVAGGSVNAGGTAILGVSLRGVSIRGAGIAGFVGVGGKRDSCSGSARA